MNYIDAYDVTTDTPPGQPSLNEEVAQITGQLGKLWGGFRKQSLNALESARKIDLAQVVTQAQNELGKLVSEEPKSATNPSPRTSTEKATGPSTAQTPRPSTTIDTATPEPVASESAVPAVDDPTTPRAPKSDLPTSPTQSFFSRIQASLPPNLVKNVQEAIPPNLVQTVQGAIPPNFVQSVQASVQGAGLAHLRGTIGAELARVQHEAEDALHRSEDYLRGAAKGAGEFLREAVKVVPPENAGGARGIAWDGSDVWMMDIALGTGLAAGATADKGKEKEVDWSSPVEARKAVATRAQALLRRLRCDPDIVRTDPEADANVKELYLAWLEHDVRSKPGGIEGKEWKSRSDQALQDSSDGEALKTTIETLVPSELTNEIFWTRYWFRVHQIQREEEKRQALLRVSEGKEEEEISWEDDDDEPTTPATKARADAKSPIMPSAPAPVAPAPASATTAKGAPAAAAAATAAAGAELASQGLITPTPTSPRHSDEGSYDVVSAVQSTDEKESEEESDEESDEEESGEEDEDEDEGSDEGETPLTKPAAPVAGKPDPSKAAPPSAKEKNDESDDSDWE